MRKKIVPYRNDGFQMQNTSPAVLQNQSRSASGLEDYATGQDAAKPVDSSEPKPNDLDNARPASLEVEFALVIARMIDVLKNDPENMRHAIYELARHKLQEQFHHIDTEQQDRTKQALETAIRGVEAFAEQGVDVLGPTLKLQFDSPRNAFEATDRSYFEPIAKVGAKYHSGVDAHGSSQTPPRWFLVRPIAAMVTIFVAILAIIAVMVHIVPTLERKPTVEERIASLEVSNYPVPNMPPAKPAPLRPTDYGVYAINNDALIGLSLLPGRPPDIRIQVSAAITTPRGAILRNGHPKFLVFRRDIANITDRAEVRIVAKVEHEFSAGMISKKPDNDTWVMRNISFPFRVSPVNDNAEMVELHSEDPTLELSPGRYALILKNQAYDFSVEGQPTNPKLCLERIIASNGTFYSDCKSP
jgi:hypothetical protein